MSASVPEFVNRVRSHHRLRTAALLALLLFCGCQTATKHHLAAIADFEACAPQPALTSFDDAAAARKAETEIIRVDRAIASLMSGNVHDCESALRETRQQMDFLRQKDLREQTAAVLTDDKAVAWSGREFEQRMVDNLLILSSLLGNQQDAFAYATQVSEKMSADLAELSEEKSENDVMTVGHTRDVSASAVPPPARFSANAFGAYLHAAVNSENAMNSDVTDRSVRQVAFWSPSLHDRPADDNGLPTAFGTRTSQGHGVLHIITFAGRVSEWDAETAAPTSAALLIADQILSAVGDHSLPPTVAPVRIARPREDSSTHRFVTVAALADGPPDAAPVVSQTIVDLNKAAWDSYVHDRDHQIARAVARRIVKKGAVYAAKDYLSVSNNTGVDLLLNLGGIAWEALEKPDTRHINLLPAHIESLQMELPVGQHTIRVSSLLKSRQPSAGRPGADVQTVTVPIDDGRNTFIVCFRPNDHTGQMRIVNPARGSSLSD
ncbi:MAG: hypothetical protein RIK87_18190 [Fuerstiella sp.]